MPEHILFLTGRLAHTGLTRVLDYIGPPFSYEIRDLGLSVAALMTTEMIRRRLGDPGKADRIVVPGLCSGPVDTLAADIGIEVEKGPKDLKDLPEYFGGRRGRPDLTEYSIRIFAEIVDAPLLSIEAICARAEHYRGSGADVIDLGCLPETAFAHMEDAITALHESSFAVSVDSMDTSELLRAGQAGADYLLSLKESTAWVAGEVGALPVLIPEYGGNMASLYRTIETFEARGRAYWADPILDPIHFGFTDSIARYAQLRERFPAAPIMMGTGNLTELTDGDTTGTTALLLGIASELDVAAILTTEVSPHARTAVKEADRARRIMYLAKRESSLPRGYDDGLMALRDRKPFTYTEEEIAELARAVKDPSYRIQVSERGLHIYNREGLHQATDPFALYPRLGVHDDAAHAFYLGTELARAQIAWQLGKRYLQDQPLVWGCVVPEPEPGDGSHTPESASPQREGEK